MIYSLLNKIPDFAYILDISEPDWVPKFKFLSDFDLIIVEKGDIDVLLDSKKYYVPEKSYVMGRPGQIVYINRTSKDTRAFILHFKTEEMQSRFKDELNEDGKIFDENYIIVPLQNNYAASNVSFYVNNLYDDIIYKKYGYNDLKNQYVYLILIELQRLFFNERRSNLAVNYDISNNYYMKIMSYLSKHYGDKITSDGIEQLIGLNYDYLNRIFKKICNKSIMEALFNIRMSIATELIITTDFHIREIAEMVGFNDEHYFCRCFTKLHGMPPLRFKKQYIMNINNR